MVLHAGDEGVAGRVVALQDGEAVILLDAPELLELDGTARPATLSFTPGIHPVGLAGHADLGPLDGTARFTVVDPTSRPELTLPGGGERLGFEVRVVRCTARGTAVAFGAASPELATFVLRCRAVLAERLAARAAA